MLQQHTSITLHLIKTNLITFLWLLIPHVYIVIACTYTHNLSLPNKINDWNKINEQQTFLRLQHGNNNFQSKIRNRNWITEFLSWKNVDTEMYHRLEMYQHSKVNGDHIEESLLFRDDWSVFTLQLKFTSSNLFLLSF